MILLRRESSPQAVVVGVSVGAAASSLGTDPRHVRYSNVLGLPGPPLPSVTLSFTPSFDGLCTCKDKLTVFLSPTPTAPSVLVLPFDAVR